MFVRVRLEAFAGTGLDEFSLILNHAIDIYTYLYIDKLQCAQNASDIDKNISNGGVGVVGGRTLCPNGFLQRVTPNNVVTPRPK